MGKVCARFSIDGHSSFLVIWNPFSSWRSLITDPGSNCYHFNHRDDWSAYAFVGVYGCDGYRIMSLTKRHLVSAGYDMNVFESEVGHWTPCVQTPTMVDKLGNRYAVFKHCVFWINSEGWFWKKPVSVVRYSSLDSIWSEIEIGANMCVEHPVLIGREDGVDFVSYERSSVRFGVHLVAINIGSSDGMEWGRSLFIGDPNLMETPCGLLGVVLLSINHFICGFDVFDPSFDAAMSEAQFRAICLDDGVVRFVGRMR
ncbi:hypothetical protein HN51_021777 [Arachis hypogaea]|nr:uncharacterized protein DS421_2g42950 [Arachis hypogaea]